MSENVYIIFPNPCTCKKSVTNIIQSPCSWKIESFLVTMLFRKIESFDKSRGRLAQLINISIWGERTKVQLLTKDFLFFGRICGFHFYLWNTGLIQSFQKQFYVFDPLHPPSPLKLSLIWMFRRHQINRQKTISSESS